jgi:hypothetical protein
MTAYRDGWTRGGGAAPGTRRPLGTGSGRAFGNDPDRAPARDYGRDFGSDPGSDLGSDLGSEGDHA